MKNNTLDYKTISNGGNTFSLEEMSLRPSASRHSGRRSSPKYGATRCQDSEFEFFKV